MAVSKKSKKADAGTLVLNTLMLKEMVCKSVKGAGMSRLLPITQMMCVRLKNGVLELITTDNTNYFYVRQSDIEGDEFYAVVGAEQFSKLISKLTCESVSLKLSTSAVEVKGNGKYMVPLQFDEDGSIVQYPDPLAEFEAEGESTEIITSTVGVILNAIKPTLATTLERPCYTGYYVGDRVVGTDALVIGILDESLFIDAKLISVETMDLLGLFDAENISVDFKDNVAVFSSPNCAVYSHVMEELEDYPISDILEYADMEFPAVCKLPKNSLLQLLDRLSLFVSDFDNGGINMAFTDDGLQISSLTSSGIETVPYTEENDVSMFSCKMDLPTFLKHLKTHVSDVVEMYYGDENAIKIVDGSVIKVIGLLEDNDDLSE